MKTELIKLATTPATREDRARAAATSLPVLAAQPAATAASSAQAKQQQAAARAATDDVNRQLAEKGSQLTIEFDDALDRAVFRLVDSQTGEVVRQIPSAEVLAIARALAEGADAGVMLSTNA